MWTVLLIALFGCGSNQPAEPPAPEIDAPKPATTPPQPELPPPVAPLGGPKVLMPGNYYPEELQIAEGEAVQVLCKDRIIESRLQHVPVGEGRVHPTVAECPNYEILFRGLQDRLGSGTIKLGIGRGPFARQKPRDFEAAYTRGHLRAVEQGPLEKRGYKVEMVPDEGEPVFLYEMEESMGTAALLWCGDLDDDNVPDFIFNSPITRENHQMRLFLSAQSKDQKPELAVMTPFTLW